MSEKIKFKSDHGLVIWHVQNKAGFCVRFCKIFASCSVAYRRYCRPSVGVALCLCNIPLLRHRTDDIIYLFIYFFTGWSFLNAQVEEFSENCGGAPGWAPFYRKEINQVGSCKNCMTYIQLVEDQQGGFFFPLPSNSLISITLNKT